MEVSAIKIKENKPQQVSYIKAGLIGAGAGYALKYILPITKQERDGQFKIFKIFTDDFVSRAQEARLDEIETIKKYKTKIPGADMFLNIMDKSQPSEFDAEKMFEGLNNKLKNATPEAKEAVSALINRVINRGKEVQVANSEFTKDCVNAITKRIRPTGAFVISGIVISLVGTLLYNMNKRISGPE